MVRLGMRREAERREVDDGNDRVSAGVDDGDFAGRLIRHIDEHRRDQRQQDVHGTGADGCFFKMNNPSVMLLTATTPLLKNG